MKRRDLIRELVDVGCYLRRRGKKHNIYMNPKNGKKAPIPRHYGQRRVDVTKGTIRKKF